MRNEEKAGQGLADSLIMLLTSWSVPEATIHPYTACRQRVKHHGGCGWILPRP